jgi:crotonobetainyl-CoA:carnitine CoA-transferase CaiB-like acyl-CoA transferase
MNSRHWGPPNVGEDAAYFMAVNRNKRSVTLDLKDHADIATARALIADADVVVENWRPGTADRLGLGAADLRAEHPGLIVCSISGFGQNAGPRSGYDQIVQGTSGVMSLTGPIGEPTKWGVPVGDIAAGMFAAYAIAAALYQRRETGLGNTIDVAMQDCLLSMLTHHGSPGAQGRTAHRDRPGAVRTDGAVGARRARPGRSSCGSGGWCRRRTRLAGDAGARHGPRVRTSGLRDGTGTQHAVHVRRCRACRPAGTPSAG